MEHLDQDTIIAIQEGLGSAKGFLEDARSASHEEDWTGFAGMMIRAVDSVIDAVGELTPPPPGIGRVPVPKSP
jgi:hypothetical protein